jgi:hypothetical protein
VCEVENYLAVDFWRGRANLDGLIAGGSLVVPSNQLGASAEPHHISSRIKFRNTKASLTARNHPLPPLRSVLMGAISRESTLDAVGSLVGIEIWLSRWRTMTRLWSTTH